MLFTFIAKAVYGFRRTRTYRLALFLLAIEYSEWVLLITRLAGIAEVVKVILKILAQRRTVFRSALLTAYTVYVCRQTCYTQSA